VTEPDDDPPRGDAGDRQAALAFLAANHVMALATRAEDGPPHLVSLLYVHDGFALDWVSDPASRHSRHLAAEPRCAAAVAPDTQAFQTIQGLQMRGEARRLDGVVERTQAMARLAMRYDFLARIASQPGALVDAWNKAAVYRFIPRRILWIDNRQGFGHKRLIDA
jgi:uncharacterized protein YhbP (UPF0306 family)